MKIPEPEVVVYSDGGTDDIYVTNFRTVANVLNALTTDGLQKVMNRMYELWQNTNGTSYPAPMVIAEDMRRRARQDKLWVWGVASEQAQQMIREAVRTIVQALDEAINGDLLFAKPPLWVITAEGKRYAVETSSSLDDLEQMIFQIQLPEAAAEAIKSNYTKRLENLMEAAPRNTAPMLPMGDFPEKSYHGSWCTTYYVNGSGYVIAELPMRIEPRYSVFDGVTYEAPEQYRFVIRAKVRCFMQYQPLRGYIIHKVRVYRKSGKDLVTPHISSTNACLGEMDLSGPVTTLADLARFRDQLATLLSTVNADSPLYSSSELGSRWHPFLDPVEYGFAKVETVGWEQSGEGWSV